MDHCPSAPPMAFATGFDFSTIPAGADASLTFATVVPPTARLTPSLVVVEYARLEALLLLAFILFKPAIFSRGFALPAFGRMQVLSDKRTSLLSSFLLFCSPCGNFSCVHPLILPSGERVRDCGLKGSNPHDPRRRCVPCFSLPEFFPCIRTLGLRVATPPPAEGFLDRAACRFFDATV